jgi:hypothetical protein
MRSYRRVLVPSKNKRERGIWQRRYWDTIQNSQDL